jgi:hypothetical protein
VIEEEAEEEEEEEERSKEPSNKLQFPRGHSPNPQA